MNDDGLGVFAVDSGYGGGFGQVCVVELWCGVVVSVLCVFVVVVDVRLFLCAV